MGNNTLITNNLYSAKVSSSICCVFKSPSHAEDVPARGDSHLHLSSPKKLKSLQVNVQARSCNFCRKKKNTWDGDCSSNPFIAKKSEKTK